MFLEAFAKIIAVAVTDPGGYVGNLIAGILKKLFGLFHPVFRYVLIQRTACFILKKRAYIRSRKKYMCADVFYRQSLFHIILADILFDQENRRIFLLRFSHIPEICRSLIRKGLMQFRKSKTSGNGFRNAVRSL